MKTKFLFKYIISFILFISVYIFIVSLNLKMTIFNEEYLKEKLDSNNYYVLLYDKVNEEMSYYIIQSGLEEDVIKDIVSFDKLKEDINLVIHTIYNNEELLIDTKVIEEKLNRNIDSYLINKNIKVDDKKDLDNFVSSITNVYRERVGFSNSTIFLSNYLFIYSNKINALLIISSAFIFSSFIFLKFVLNKETFSDVLISCGFALLLTVFLVKNNINIDNIYFYSNEVSLIIKSIFKDILHNFNLVSVCLLIFSIILIIFKEITKRKSNNSY